MRRDAIAPTSTSGDGAVSAAMLLHPIYGGRCSGAVPDQVVPLLVVEVIMIIIGLFRSGWLNVFKNPADAQAPYRADLRLPNGRHYSARMRSHPAASAGPFWYEGFVTAGHADDYSRDQQMVRYPASPSLAPQRWDLLPCQIKINPYAGNHGRGRNVIGTMWVSRKDGAEGGELFTLLARHCHGGSLVITGDILRYRQPRRDLLAASRSSREYASGA